MVGSAPRGMSVAYTSVTICGLTVSVLVHVEYPGFSTRIVYVWGVRLGMNTLELMKDVSRSKGSFTYIFVPFGRAATKRPPVGSKVNVSPQLNRYPKEYTRRGPVASRKIEAEI